MEKEFEKLYKAVIELDKAKDAYFDDPNGFIKYLKEVKNYQQINFVNFFALLKTFGKGGFEKYLKIMSEVQKPDNNNNYKGMTEKSYTRNEVVRMFGVKQTAVTNWKNGKFCVGTLKCVTGKTKQSSVSFRREDIVEFLNSNPKFNGSFKPNLWNVDI
jgi:hypothetical protein